MSLNPDYSYRINNVFQFIEEHLDAKLSLEQLADIACFSPFHFHRIFKAITGETLNEYITRKRLEKAAGQLIHRRELPVSELSLMNGFNNNSSFTRAFKKFYGVSPTEFRAQNPRHSKIGQTERKIGQESEEVEKYICNMTNLKNWIEMNAKIEIKELPTMHFAYVTSIGDQQLAGAFNRLIQWATPRGLMTKEDTRLATIYYDSFKVTPPDKVRMSACILIDDTVEVGGDIGKTSTEQGKYIIARFEIKPEEFEKSWSSLFIWMNEQGYSKADRPPFEIYYNNFNEHPERLATVDFCIPID